MTIRDAVHHSGTYPLFLYFLDESGNSEIFVMVNREPGRRRALGSSLAAPDLKVERRSSVAVRRFLRACSPLGVRQVPFDNQPVGKQPGEKNAAVRGIKQVLKGLESKQRRDAGKAIWVEAVYVGRELQSARRLK